MARIDHGAIAERARGQLGLITNEQLDSIGLTRRQIDGLVDAGVLRRLRRGVLALSASPESAKQRLLAATLAAGPSAVASHRTAAWLWGFDGVQPEGMEVTVDRARSPVVRGAVVHRATDLDPVDVTRIGPQPVTTVARTLIDVSPVLTMSDLEEALDGACRRGQVRVDYLQWRLDALRRPGRPGLSALAELLHTPHRERPESWLESAFLRVLRAHFLPVPRLQVTIQPGPGKKVRLDSFFDDQHLVVEVSGHATHSTRRQRQADAQRHARLVAAGFRVVEFTYEDIVERPTYVAHTISQLLELSPVGPYAPTA